jgi:D-arabinose 1-dehydrogenase-like Zn-dependent alcohol dehydrogenase
VKKEGNMLALVLEGPKTSFELVERPIPTPGPGQALVKVRAVGSGLTIQHTKAGRSPANWPIVIGHEIAGEVVEVGAGVTDFKPGDRVTPYYYLSCGDCKWCRLGREPLCLNLKGHIGRDIDGGYAEYCVLPAWNLVHLPPELPYDEHPAEVAIISDAIATPLKVARKARIAPLEKVAVIGAGGGVGIHMVQLAKVFRGHVIAVDLGPEKLDLARSVGADETLDAKTTPLAKGLRDAGGESGLDVVLDFVGTPETITAGLDALGRAGRFVAIGGQRQTPVTMTMEQIRGRELELLGSRFVSKQTLIDALDLVAAGLVKPVVTVTGKLEDAEAIHDRLEEGSIPGRAALVLY